MDDDEATTTAAHEIRAAPPPGPVGNGPVRLGGPVVAAAPDDALQRAQLEIIAALNGEPTPGGI